MCIVMFEISINIVMKFSDDGSFELCFECNWDLPPVLFVGKTEGQSVLAVGCHLLVHTCEDDTSTACAWAAPHNSKLKEIILSKRAETNHHKEILKRNLADVEA